MLQSCAEGSHKHHALNTKFCYDVYGSVRNYSQRSADRTAFWIEFTNRNNLSFLGPAPDFPYKIATALRSISIAAYPVHVLLLHFTPTLG